MVPKEKDKEQPDIGLTEAQANPSQTERTPCRNSPVIVIYSEVKTHA